MFFFEKAKRNVLILTVSFFQQFLGFEKEN